MKNNMQKNSKSLITFQECFAYRNLWMACAILWVLIYHTPLKNIAGPLSILKQTGYGGVDIFLFASGIGCFFSLRKNPDITAFFKRRCLNILPMWLSFLTIYLIYQYFVHGISFQEIAGNIFGFGLFGNLGHQFNWYIGAMWTCYLFAPIFTDIVQKVKPIYKVLLLVILLMTSIIFCNQFQLVFWARLPIFYLGITIAENSTRKTGLSVKICLLTFMCMLIGWAFLLICMLKFPSLLWNYGLFWYPFILITPGLVLTISYASHLLSKTCFNFIIELLNKLGKHTFPLYLSHIFVFEIFIILQNKGYVEQTLTTVLISVLLSFLFAMILNYITSFTKFICKSFLVLFSK